MKTGLTRLTGLGIVGFNPENFVNPVYKKFVSWLPDVDLNHDKQIQSLLCYRYTIGQDGAVKLNILKEESRIVKMLNRYIVASELRGTPPIQRN